MTFEIAVAGVGTTLLVWAALEDAQRKKIPMVAGFGMLLLGLAVLVQVSLYVWALYYIVAIWSTRGGVWRYVLIAASLVMFWLYAWEALPIVCGVLFVATLFWMKWFGGGDAQLATGLIGVGHDWMVLGLVFGLTILAGVVLTVIRRGGLAEGGKRLVWVAGHLGDAPDEEAIRTPWAVVAAIAGVSYLWLWALML